MTIKTAVTLTTGAAVGFLFGISMSEKDKERIVSAIREKIFYALTGEKMPKKKYEVKRNYASYADSIKPKAIKEWNDIKKDVLKFDTYEDAITFLNEIHNYIQNYKSISVSEIVMMRGSHYKLAYKWTSYGWTESDLERLDILTNKSCDGLAEVYRISGPDPHLLLD